MLSSTQMMDVDQKLAIPLSEEVQDILHLARKAALKDEGSLLRDRHFLDGMLGINRLFTRLDALLKESGVSAKRLKQLYRSEKQHYENYSEPTSVMDRARQIALDTTLDGEKPRVEIEHLISALLESTDPLVQKVLSSAGLTLEKLNQAIPKVREKSASRFVLYCVRETLEVVIVVLFLVIIIKQGFGEFRLIPSESMLPTLHVGDRIVVEKVSHWYRQPQRGDVLVFYPPEPEAILRHDPWSVFLRLTGFSGILYDKESKIDTAFIKRLVGLPGDVIDVRPGKGVYINDERIDEPYINEIANTCTFINYCGPVTVPPDMYFMMGDNRNHSADSRYWQFLPEDRVIGRAVFRFYPFDKRMGVLQGPKYPETPNPSRSG
jgi:signal peptidase I